MAVNHDIASPAKTALLTFYECINYYARMRDNCTF